MITFYFGTILSRTSWGWTGREHVSSGLEPNDLRDPTDWFPLPVIADGPLSSLKFITGAASFAAAIRAVPLGVPITINIVIIPRGAIFRQRLRTPHSWASPRGMNSGSSGFGRSCVASSQHPVTVQSAQQPRQRLETPVLDFTTRHHQPVSASWSAGPAFPSDLRYSDVAQDEIRTMPVSLSSGSLLDDYSKWRDDAATSNGVRLIDWLIARLIDLLID